MSNGPASAVFGAKLAPSAPNVGGYYVGTIDFGNGPLPTEPGNGAAFIARLSP